MSGSIPYIGSKVSLIATTDIRYEGILYTLNREESTIAVQNVRSFGTEGRRKPEVPMSNEVYDFIIFRGKDLKDLTVLQGAPEPDPFSIQSIPQHYQDDHAARQSVGHHGYAPANHATVGLAAAYSQAGAQAGPQRMAAPVVPMPPAPPTVPPQAEARDRASELGDAFRPRDPRVEKSIAQRKQVAEVLRLHKRADESIGKVVKVHGAAALGAVELRALSETNPAVYHFYVDFVNYCCAPVVQSDEQQWETLCKALRKHFERDLCAQSPKLPPPQRPNSTLGDFIMIEAASGGKKSARAKRGAAAGRGTGRGEPGKPHSGQVLGSGEEPHSGASWVCPRCTLRNEGLLLECAACDTPKQQAALWAEFPPLAMA